MIHGIIKIVCDYFGVDPKLIMVKTRKSFIVKVRHLVIYFVRKMCPDLLLVEIASRFCLHHSTIIHAVDNVESLLSYDKDYIRNFQEIQTQLEEFKNRIGECRTKHFELYPMIVMQD